MKKPLFYLGAVFGLFISVLASSQTINVTASTYKPSPRSVIGTDERTRVLDTKLVPYNSVVFIAADGASGSGAVVGPNTVLTAAHVVKNIRNNPAKDSIYVIPGRDGSKLPFGKFKIKAVYIPQSYLEKPSVDSDLALITIEPLNGKSISEVVPPLLFKIVDSVSVGTKVSTAGYPGDKPWATMWKTSGTTTGETSTRLYYDLDTYGGQSGSPVFDENNEVIAVHTTGAGTRNFGTKLSSEFWSFIYEHLE